MRSSHLLFAGLALCGAACARKSSDVPGATFRVSEGQRSVHFVLKKVP